MENPDSNGIGKQQGIKEHDLVHLGNLADVAEPGHVKFASVNYSSVERASLCIMHVNINCQFIDGTSRESEF